MDTSALVKLYVEESHRALVLDWVHRSEVVATSRVAYPESCSAFARRRREGDISDEVYTQAMHVLASDFAQLFVVELSPALAHAAGELTALHPLRGFDAIHLASAHALSHLVGDKPNFLAFDRRLNQCAQDAGLPVVREPPPC
ncbi:MAG: type II toxin-antitoxin system VapC family toxin [Polyangiales bacterium]